MTQAFAFPSATNINPVASNYCIGYIRDKDQFPLNQYIQYIEAPAVSFWYTKIDRDDMIRVRNVRDHLWADGADRFDKSDANVGFREQQAFCNRYSFDKIEGNIALKKHEDQWGYKKVLLQTLTAKAMLARTLNVWQGGPGGGSEGVNAAWTGLDVASTWPATNTASVNDLNNGAGTWDKAGSDASNPGNYMAIRKSLMTAVNQIFLQTNGRVSYSDLHLVISPNLAKIMSNTDEIRDAYKYGPQAKEMIEGSKANYQDRFGLPPVYAGLPITVEDTPYLADLPTAGQTSYSTNRAFVKSDSSACILSRQGKIDAPSGPNFSTVQVAWFERQLGVEEFSDPRNAKTLISVVDFYSVIGPALESGFLLQNAI